MNSSCMMKVRETTPPLRPNVNNNAAKDKARKALTTKRTGGKH